MPGASAGVAGAGVPGSRGQPSGRPPPPSPRDFFTLCPIPGPLTGTGSYFWKFLFFFFKCNAPRFPLATCRWSQAQGPSRCSALRDPLCSEAHLCRFRAAAHHGPCCVPSACCRVPPSSPAALPRFPLPPVPPPPWPFCGLRPHPPRSRPAEPGGVRGRDRGGLSWVPTLSPGAGRREPVLRSSAARRRSRGINCTSSSNKTLKAAAGASSSRLCPDSLVRSSSRGPWGS